MVDDLQSVDYEMTGSMYGKEGLSFKGIVLEHLRAIVKAGSTEMRGGYYEKKVNHSTVATNITETYVPDTREYFINSIVIFTSLLRPHFDKQMQEDEKNFQAMIQTEQDFMKEKFPREIPDVEFERHENRKLNIHRKMFDFLNMFLERINYFEQKDRME